MKTDAILRFESASPQQADKGRTLIEHVFRFAPESRHGADLKCSESSWGAARPIKDGVDRKATGGDSVVAAQVEYGLVYGVCFPQLQEFVARLANPPLTYSVSQC